MENKKDKEIGTGHEWDGIRELKNNPPRWWMIGYALSPVFLLIYFLLYPAIPLANSNTKGLLGWTQVEEYKAGLKEVKEARAPYEKRLNGLTAQEILDNPELSEYAQASTKVVFGDNCAACHGSGGQGAGGFPSLADDDWLFGGGIEAIVESITDGREGAMPSYKDQLTTQEIDDLVAYVRGLPDGTIHEAGRKVYAGETESEADCVGCHGYDAKGIVDMGAPDLTDAIWRFDGAEEEVRRTIEHGVNSGEENERVAIMPAWSGRLTETEIRKLAVKIWSLGGGEKEEDAL